MWPTLLDMSKEESIQNLRNLELEAYSHLVSALRAQGPLSSEKLKLLKETSEALNITQERYKAEIRRAVSDEKLNTIAFHVTGQKESLDDWAQEGRRLVPLLPRQTPQTAYSAIADEVSEAAGQNNKQLPPPASTERKRIEKSQSPQHLQQANEANCKQLPFRVPEPPVKPMEMENKKRKLPAGAENSSLAQHLLGPAKVSRIQQIYRQRTKAKANEQYHKYKQQIIDQHVNENTNFNQQQQQHLISPPHPPQPPPIQIPLNSPSKQPIFPQPTPKTIQLLNPHPNSNQNIDFYHNPLDNDPNPNLTPSCDGRTKIISNLKSNISFKPAAAVPMSISSPPAVLAGPRGSGNAVDGLTPPSPTTKTIKMCPGTTASIKKSITKTVGSGQKLIVVTNAQSLPTSSILQRTLTIPFVKNFSMKNFEKFKIVSSGSNPPSNLQMTTVQSNNSVKHKVVTVRTNPSTKKVIPLSQLQVLNSKGGIKVLPLGGKIVGKSVNTTTNTVSSSPVYIMNPKIQNSVPITISAPIPNIQNPMLNVTKADNGNSLPPVVVIGNEQVVAPNAPQEIVVEKKEEEINKENDDFNNSESIIEDVEDNENILNNEKDMSVNFDDVMDVPSDDEDQVLNRFQSNLSDSGSKSENEQVVKEIEELEAESSKPEVDLPIDDVGSISMDFSDNLIEQEHLSSQELQEN